MLSPWSRTGCAIWKFCRRWSLATHPGQGQCGDPARKGDTDWRHKRLFLSFLTPGLMTDDCDPYITQCHDSPLSTVMERKLDAEV